MLTLRHSALALFLALAGFHCSASVGGPAPSGDGSADAGPQGGNGNDAGQSRSPAAELCDDLAEERCRMLQRCGLLDAAEAVRLDCEAIERERRCGPASWPARVLAGTLLFSPTIAELCATGFGSQSCAQFERDPAVCDEFLSPASPLLGACYGGAEPECTEGVCRQAGCPKRCQLPGDVGQDCEGDGECRGDAGLYCLRQSPSSYCARPGGSGDSCDADRRCGEGLFCGRSGTCATRAALDQTCEDSGCADGGYCAPGVAADGGSLCRATLGAGGTCGLDEACEPGLLCEDRQCVTAGPLDAGSLCAGRQRCGPGFVCARGVDGGGACEVPRAAGGDCREGSDCQAHLGCLFPATDGGVDGGLGGQCGPRRLDGQLCREDRECRLLSRCAADGVCRLWPRRGESCVDGCLRGLCAARDGGEPDAGKVCLGVGSPGAGCSDDQDCGSGRCSSGSCAAFCAP